MKSGVLCNGFLFSTVIIIFGLTASCTGFQCYVCNTAFQPDCDNEQVPKKYLVNCSPSTAFALSPSMLAPMSMGTQVKGLTATTSSASGSSSMSSSMATYTVSDSMSRKINKFKLSAPLDASFTVCRKQVFTVAQQINGFTTYPSVSRVVRSCGYVHEKTGCKRTDKFGNLKSICQCTEEACNEAPGNKGPSIVLFITFFFFAGILGSY